jgi:hypothetical protein
MDEDKAKGRQQNQQLRIGLYSYKSAMQTIKSGPKGPALEDSNERN